MGVKVAKIGDVDLEALKKKDNLSPTDEEAIAAGVLQDIKEVEARKSETPEQTATRETKEKEATEAQERTDLDAKAKELGLEPGATKEAIESKEIELGKRKETPEEKTAREKREADTKEKKDKDDADSKEEKDAEFNKEAESFATEAKISVEDAKKELESMNKVSDKYGNDPKKLSKAYLSQQRENVKAQERITELQKPPKVSAFELPLDSLIKHMEDGKLTVNGNAQAKETIVEAFKEKHPKLTEKADDDTVLAMAAKEIQAAFIKQEEKDLQDISVNASSRREELIKNLPEEDKEFESLITPVLQKTPDVLVMGEDYNLDELVSWARGKNSKQRETDAYERGLKKGKEGAKIIALKPEEGEAPPETNDTKEKISNLSEPDKVRAKEMYDGTNMTEEAKFLAYIEYKEKNVKK